MTNLPIDSLIWVNPFAGGEKFISPSLNRVIVKDLPGFDLQVEDLDTTGYELLSSKTLNAIINEHTMGNDITLDKLNEYLISQEESEREMAFRIVQDYGRNLGILLAVLSRGDAKNREARPTWSEKHWDYWGRIQDIWIGGGLVKGKIGANIVRQANAILRTTGIQRVSLNHATFSDHLPVVGLARIAPKQTASMLLLDFGHSFVKRALADYQDGLVTELRKLPKIKSLYNGDLPSQSDHEFIEQSLTWIANLITHTWREARSRGWIAGTHIAVSMACYIKDGHPPSSELGFYGRLQLITKNLQSHLTNMVSNNLKKQVAIQIMHDGSAAALPYSKIPDSAVLMLGTAVGVGFPPLESNVLLPYAKNIKLS